MTGDPRHDRREQAARIHKVGVLTLAGLTTLLGLSVVRVVQLQVWPDPLLRSHLTDRISRREVPAPRGDITDRVGRVLSSTRTGFRIFVDPTQLKQETLTSTIASLAEVSGEKPEEVAQRIYTRMNENVRRVDEGRNPIRYLSIGKTLTDGQLEAARRLTIKGMHLELRPVREEPGGEPAASFVGKVGVDDNGLMGAELAFQQYLSPQDGYLDYVRDAKGRPMWVEPGQFRNPTAGQDVRLSFDLALQQIAFEEIRRGVEEADAAGGRIIVADPNTGEILAMVDHIRDVPGLITYDKKRHNIADTSLRFVTINPDPDRAKHPALGRNRCIVDVYEPGSTFKTFMWSAVTDRGLARPEEVFNTYNGTYTLPYGRVVRDVFGKPSLTWSDVLVQSSNIGMVQGTSRLTYEQMHADVLRFGFGQRTNIGPKKESPGIVTPLAKWTHYTQTSVSFGYEVSVTPLQMIRAFSVFARSGELMGTLPELRMTAADSRNPAPQIRYRVLQDWVVQAAREAMKDVGSNMTRRALQEHESESQTIEVRRGMFGKSGTANVVRPGGGAYIRHQYVSSFVAAAPFDQPRLVILVTIDDPGPSMIRRRAHFGSIVAGPVVLRTLNRALDYLGVPEPPRDEPAKGKLARSEP
ncbi:MAG: penicillin-binding protein 2 [Phycisphaerales bacterium]|nr:penicillin-binding protein 2 [Phycisphaerales bacterium]